MENATNRHYHVTYRLSFAGPSLEKTIRTKKALYAFTGDQLTAKGGWLETVKTCDGNMSDRCNARANGSVGQPAYGCVPGGHLEGARP